MHSLVWCGALSGDRRYGTFELCYGSLIVRGQVANDSKETGANFTSLCLLILKLQRSTGSVTATRGCAYMRSLLEMCWMVSVPRGFCCGMLLGCLSLTLPQFSWQTYRPKSLHSWAKFTLTQLLTKQTSAWGSEDISHFTQVHSRPCFFPLLCFHWYTWVWIRW